MKLSSHKKRTDRTSDLSTTGFIDVVFLLLIFFLVTSTFQLPEKQTPANIAIKKDNSSSPVRDLEPAIIQILLVNGEATYKIGAFTTNDEQQLNEFLANFVNKQDGAFVRPAGEVPFDATAKAIAACRGNGFNTVSYVPSQ